MNVYARLYQEIRPHGKLLAGVMSFSIVIALLELVPSLLTGLLVDNALLGGDERLLYLLALALTGALIVRTLAHWTRMLFTGKLGQLVLYQLRTKLYEHLQKLSLSFYNNKRTGQIMSRVTNDVNMMEEFIVEGLRDMTINLLKVSIISVILFLKNPQLALMTLIPTVPLAWGTRTFSSQIRNKYRSMRRRLADMSSILSDTIAGIQVVQVFGQEETEARKFRLKSREFYDAGIDSNRLQAMFYPSVNFAFGVGQVIVWVLGGREVLAGRLKTGELVMFSGLVAQFYAPVQSLSQSSNLFASTAASAERVYEILDLQPDIQTEPEAKAMENVRGEVTFENVTFGYDSSEPALQEVSLRVAPGQTVGLVGPSGSGKSTLVSLISRFYDVSGGAVKIDGQDVRELDLKELRSNISVVLQEPYLFHGTIRDNIAYGRPDANFGDVLAAAKAANAHEFVMKLGDGYDTHVGERGTKLSGGQRQRISIARAILDDPKILILDEATSAVDTESEALIQEALDNLMKDRTTIAIAHRLSTVKNADKLVVMENGRVIEEGTHDELVQHEDSLYKKLVEMQTNLSSTLAQ